MSKSERVFEETYVYGPVLNPHTVSVMEKMKTIPFYPVAYKTTDNRSTSCNTWGLPKKANISITYLSRIVNSVIKRVMRKGYDVPAMAVLFIINIDHIRVEGISICSGSETHIDLKRGVGLARSRALKGVISKFGWEKAAELGLIDTKHDLGTAFKLSQLETSDKKKLRIKLKNRSINDKK